MQFPCAIPGALRLRTVHPLIDGDGACSLVYDVERAAVFEVPEELKLYVAPALETGNLDEQLLGWLASADLLTAESSWDGHAGLGDLASLDPPHGPGAAAAATCESAGAAGAGGRWGLCAAGHENDETHGWIDQPEAAAAIEAIDVVWRRGLGSSRIKLHLDWAGTFPADGLFEKVVVHARRRAALSGQEVGFELTLDPELVSPEVARRLAAHPVHVRLRCGECDPLARLGTCHENRPWLLAEAAVRLLLAPATPCPAAASPLLDAAAPPPMSLHPPLLTVQCILDGPARLIELWRWAKAIGVRSLDAIRLEDPGAGDRPGLASPAAPIREYRQDLYGIYEETCAELEAGGSPIEFQPLTRIVRRLLRSEAVAAMPGCPGEPGGRGDGRRFARVESFDPRLLPELLWMRLEEPAESEASSLPCQACWARQVCSHSAYVASALGKEDPRAPSRERCGYWSAEVETAVRLFHRLEQIDAIEVLRFLEDAPSLQAPRPPWSHGEASSLKPS